MRTDFQLLIASAVLVGTVALSVYILTPRNTPKTASLASTAMHAVPQPPFTPELADRLKASNGFQVLISYTDRGFEPQSVSIKQGDVLRFVNNSMQPLLWVASTGASGKIYPGQGECGQSDFDTCESIKPGEFWEFKFTHAGTWSYKNNADISKTGTVTVR